jgi:NAD(P)-dependent dehydrogenase (short-subunit alcohol dehydrogenase family)
MKIKNSTVVITGAGSGMGRAMTLEVIRRGGRVAAIDLRRENLDETRRLAGTSPNDIELGHYISR